jgi:MOSC domain-containing protein YiiM
MPASGLVLAPGDFGENLTTAGIDLAGLPVGSTLRIGSEAELEVTQIGKECHLGCEIRRQVGDCVMPREGIFARVTKPGAIAAGDPIEVGVVGEPR